MNNANITLTPAASAHIRNQLNLTQANYLRLGVKESGCNGYMYMLDFLEAPGANDECFDFGENVQICVDAEVMAMVEGTEVDMLTEGLNSALVFKNPNATSYCGCGESFAVADEQDSGTDPSAASAVDLATDVGTN
jgi:iron-sulfur cluster assembly protein